MIKQTITIEEIKNNPNLDLSERISLFSTDERWNNDDLKELAIASIKQEYEYWAKNMSDNPNIESILEEILNGRVFSQEEVSILLNPEKSELLNKYFDIKKRIQDNNGVTQEDFDELCNVIGFDQEMIDIIQDVFNKKGLIIDSNNLQIK